MHQSNHQEDGTDHAAGKHDTGQPRQISEAQRRFSSRAAREMTTDLQRSQPDAGAKIKQARQHPGIEHAQQQFGERRAGAEQQRRGQGKKNSGCCYVRMIGR